MGLPPYSGPFQVGAIDLEIPVRQPRSFCNDVVRPDELNRPSRRARREAKRAQHRNVKEGRVAEGGTDPQSSSPAEASSADNLNHAGRADGIDDGEGDEDEDEAGGPAWSPFTTGSKTSTLHLETVLFAVYYPCKPLTKAEAKQYPPVAWLGRPMHTGVGALLSYLGQYGAFAIPAAPAVLALLRSKLPALAGPPLADPEKLRQKAKQNTRGADEGSKDKGKKRGIPGDRATAGNFGQLPPQLPIVVFSHGLAGNRLSYSQFCGELASYGLIVVALEHRDGSGVSSIVRGEEAPSKAEQTGLDIESDKKTEKKPAHPKVEVPYFSFEKLGLNSFSDSPSGDEAKLRRDQLEMRHAEIAECLYVLDEINKGNGPDLVRRSTRKLCTKLAGKKADGSNEHLPSDSIIRQSEPLADWKGKLDLSYPTLCGHSFGGATVLELMRDEEKSKPFPFAMVLDPWVSPVRDPEEDAEVKSLLKKPVYVLNSESFTVWEDHFKKLKRICLDARKSNDEERGWLMTLCGSKHTDFSDYPFLLPKVFRSTVGPRKTIEVFVKATYLQMGLNRQRRREKHELPGFKVSDEGKLHDDQPEADGSPERQQDAGLAMSSEGRDAQHAETGEEPLAYNGNPPHHDSGGGAVPRDTQDTDRKKSAEPVINGKPGDDGDEEHRDFVAESRMLELIDADRDAEEVHAQLEKITAGWNYTQTRPRSLMSLFMLYHGFQPGLEKPGRVLVHKI